MQADSSYARDDILVKYNIECAMKHGIENAMRFQSMANTPSHM